MMAPSLKFKIQAHISWRVWPCKKERFSIKSQSSSSSLMWASATKDMGYRLIKLSSPEPVWKAEVQLITKYSESYEIQHHPHELQTGWSVSTPPRSHHGAPHGTCSPATFASVSKNWLWNHRDGPHTSSSETGRVI